MEKPAFALFRTLYPFNLGMTARIMKNFGFSQLILVDPHCFPFSEEARQFAMGGYSLIERAILYKDLQSLREEWDFVAATTHTGGAKRPLLLPITELQNHIKGYRKPVILFGSEAGGLSLHELHRADLTFTIPSEGSLNLSHAVAIVAWELTREKQSTTQAQEMLASLESWLIQALEEKGFFDPSRHLPGAAHLRRLLRKMKPSPQEARFLFALFRFLLQPPKNH